MLSCAVQQMDSRFLGFLWWNHREHEGSFRVLEFTYLHPPTHLRARCQGHWDNGVVQEGNAAGQSADPEGFVFVTLPCEVRGQGCFAHRFKELCAGPGEIWVLAWPPSQMFSSGLLSNQLFIMDNFMF